MGPRGMSGPGASAHMWSSLLILPCLPGCVLGRLLLVSWCPGPAWNLLPSLSPVRLLPSTQGDEDRRPMVCPHPQPLAEDRCSHGEGRIQPSGISGQSKAGAIPTPSWQPRGTLSRQPRQGLLPTPDLGAKHIPVQRLQPRGGHHWPRVWTACANRN